MPYPSNYHYSQAHLWVRAEEAGQALVGITDFAQESLGEVMYVDLPPVGTEFAQGVSFGTVESSKVVSDLIAPVSGVVLALNGALLNDPAAVNRDPYEGGWMLRVRLAKPDELTELLGAQEYQASIRR